MQLLATAEQMQQLDRVASRKIGIPGLVLMENAGRAFVDALEKKAGALWGKKVTIICGKGNNGGDGYVIARHVLNRGGVATVHFLCGRSDIKGDAKTNLDVLFAMLPGFKDKLRIVADPRGSRLKRLPEPDVIVDAIFGTGFKGSARGAYRSAIQWINGARCLVVSVDIASGVSASDGIVEGEAVQATLTVAMGLPKIGQFVGAGRKSSGEIVVADISIPQSLFEKSGVTTFHVSGRDVASVLPERPLTAHKYSVGKIFVVAGSRQFTGAPFMCAQAAMKTGAGAVILGTPRSVQPVLARKFTEVMIAPLDETSAGSLSLSTYDSIMERSDWADTVVIGPGVSRETETLELMARLVRSIAKPVVIDADALFAMSGKPRWLKQRKDGTVLTPHTGELDWFVGQGSSQIESNRVEVARQAALTLRSVVCLKGSPTVTAMPSGRTFVNSTGNPGMATIGAGDVLAGVIASLIAQGVQIGEAAFSGVFIHGLAGDNAANKLGARSVMALDILNSIPEALMQVEMA